MIMTAALSPFLLFYTLVIPLPVLSAFSEQTTQEVVVNFFQSNISRVDLTAEDAEKEHSDSLMTWDEAEMLGDTITTEDEEQPDREEVAQCGVGAPLSCQGRCGVFRESPCSCHAQCLVYRTCCGDFRRHCPQTEQELSSAERVYLDADVACPDALRWPVVAGCPRDVDPHGVHRCHATSPATKSDVIPVTDRISGVHFKSVHCARCNGVESSSLLPWSGEFLIARDVTTIDDLFEVAISWKNFSDYHPVVWHSPGEGVSHSRCVPDTQTAVPPVACQNRTFHTCESAPSSHVTVDVHGVVRSYRDHHCLLCDADQVSWISCLPVEAEEPGRRYYYMEMTWNDSDRGWVFRGRPSGYDHHVLAMSVDTITCNASEDLEPYDCRLLSCPPSHQLKDDQCQAVLPSPHTLFFTIQTLFHDMFGGLINATGLLQEMNQLFDQLTFNEQQVLVSVEHGEATKEDGYWSFSFRVFVNILTHRRGVYLQEEWRLSLLTLLQDRGINFTRFCSSVMPRHVTYHVNCTEFVTYALVYEDGSGTLTATDQGRDRDAAFLGDLRQDKRTWRSYLSMTFITVSILSLAVRVLLQPVLTFFHSRANRLQFFLCLALMMGYITFMLGGLPSPGSLACVLTAVATHWALLSALLWMNVNAILIWRIFRPKNWSRLSWDDVTHYGWHLYAWLSPLLLVGPQVALDQLLPLSEYAPLYGRGQCWFNRGRALLFFFIIPSLLISVVNLFLIILITYAVHTQKMRYGNAATSVLLEVKACSKLVVLVGVTWLLGIPVAVYDEPILGDIFTLANANLGFFIAVAIMGNKFFIKDVKEQWARQGRQLPLQSSQLLHFGRTANRALSATEEAPNVCVAAREPGPSGAPPAGMEGVVTTHLGQGF